MHNQHVSYLDLNIKKLNAQKNYAPVIELKSKGGVIKNYVFYAQAVKISAN